MLGGNLSFYNVIVLEFGLPFSSVTLICLVSHFTTLSDSALEYKQPGGVLYAINSRPWCKTIVVLSLPLTVRVSEWCLA